MKTSLRALLALGAVALVAACAAGPQSGGGGPFSAGAAEPDDLRVRVENLNFNEARIWLVVRGGERRSLGRVAGKSDAEFVVRWELSRPASIEIDLVAGGRCSTEELQLAPGDAIDLQIPSRFRTGTCSR